MAAIEAQPLVLWLIDPPSTGQASIGQFVLIRLDRAASNAERGLRLVIEYRPPAEGEPNRLVSLELGVRSVYSVPRTYGRVVLGGTRNRSLSRDPNTWPWLWHLADEDIEAIERDRGAPGGATEVVFNLDVEGIAMLQDQPWGFFGSTQFRMATQTWLELIAILGYNTPPSVAALAAAALTGDASWARAEERLRDAWQHLQRGEDRQALTSAYLKFDQIVRNPYRAAWGDALFAEDEPHEKADVVGALLKAHASILNKLGRHPSDEASPKERGMLPLDHWETELALALSQLLLTAAERWGAIKAANE